MTASSTRSTRSWTLWLGVTVLLAASGVALLLYHTRYGPGITGDSVHYVMGAKNLLAGNGYARTSGGGELIPITGFPPLFSLALVGVGLFTRDLFNGGRVLNALLFGVNIALAGFLIYRSTRWAAAAWFGSLLVLLSDDLILVHSWIMSEGLFIALMLAGLWGLSRYLITSRRTTLVLSAAAVALATLTRYVGVSLIGAGLLGILLLSRQTWKRRLIDGILLVVIGLGPLALWFARNAAIGGSLTNRGLGFHPITPDLLVAFLGTANAWFFPQTLGVSRGLRGAVSAAIAFTLPALFALGEVRASRQSGQAGAQPATAVPWLVLFLVPVYLVVLALNTTFLDASTSPAGAARYLAPVFVAGVVGLACMLARLLEASPARSAPRLALLVLGLALAGMYAQRAVAFVSNPGASFRYTDVRRGMPELVAALADLDPARILISNDVEQTYVLAGRPAYLLPIRFDLYLQRPRADFEAQLAVARARVRAGALIVLFGGPNQDQLDTLARLLVVPVRTFDGVTWYADPAAQIPGATRAP